MKDELAKDLLALIDDSVSAADIKVPVIVPINTDLLMQKLCAYIVRRDHKIHDHAYKLGKASNENSDQKA